jgi:hypothetical protein
MTSHPFASIGTAKSRLRNRIVSAQRIITVAPASPCANTHVTMAAYNGACEHLRSDIMRARKLFPDTNALLTGPQHGVADDALGQDRISLALTIRTTKEETEKRRRTS